MSTRILNVVAIVLVLGAAPFLVKLVYDSLSTQREADPAAERAQAEAAYVLPTKQPTAANAPSVAATIAKPPSTAASASAERTAAKPVVDEIDPRIEAYRQRAQPAVDEFQKLRLAMATFMERPHAENVRWMEHEWEQIRRPELMIAAYDGALSDTYRYLCYPHQQSTLAGYTDEDWKQQLKNWDQWRKYMPRHSAPLIAKAGLLVHYAWKARGNGFAYSVSEQSFMLFEERIEQAREALDEAAKLGDLDPYYYQTRITIEMAAGGDKNKVRDYIDEMAKTWPRYWPAYEAAAMFYLPRWHGDPGDAEQFANEIYDEIGGEDGKWAFFHVLNTVKKYDPYTVRDGDFDRQKMGAAIRTAIALLPTKDSLDLAAEVAWRNQDVELAQVVAQENSRLPAPKRYTSSVMQATEALARTGESDFGERVLWVPMCGSTPTSPDISPVSGVLCLSTRSKERPPVMFAHLKPDLFMGALPPSRYGGIDSRFVNAQRECLLVHLTDNESDQLLLYDSALPERSVRCKSVDERVYCPVISPDLGYIAASEQKSHQTVFLWDAKTGEKTAEISIPNRAQWLEFSADSQTLMVCCETEYYTCDVATQELHKHSYGANWWAVTAPKRDAQGRMLLQVLDRQGHCQWLSIDPNTHEIETLELGENRASRTSISFDGRYLAVMHSHIKRSVTVWDLKSMEVIFEREFPVSGIRDLAIAPDGGTLVCIEGNGAILLFDIPRPPGEGAPVAPLNPINPGNLLEDGNVL